MKVSFNIIMFLGLLSHISCGSKDINSPKNIQSPLNILWIIADDLGTDIGSYGNDIIHTPHLDKLASESKQYSNFNTVNAVCSPSRSALITGMYPVSFNVHQHRTRYKRKLADDIIPVTEYFKDSGYFVTNGSSAGEEVQGKTDYNFEHVFSEMYDGTHWRQRKNNEPFFSQIQISYPHRPFARDSVHPIHHDKITLPPIYPDHELLRKDWALYLETIQLVDKLLGEVIDDLEEDGLRDKTVIFFFGDQGRPHVKAKQYLYTPGTNTPLLIRWPDGRYAGTVSEDLVSTIDLPVAALDLAYIPKPANMAGINFLKNKREYIYTMRDRRDETVDRIRAVRNKKYKYIKNYYPERPFMQANVYKDMRYPARPLLRLLRKDGQLNKDQLLFLEKRPKEELYDLEKDPDELNNLATVTSYKNVLIDMTNRLEKWVLEFDKGIYPEDPQEIDFASQLSQQRRKKILDNRGMSEDVTDLEMIAYWNLRFGLVD